MSNHEEHPPDSAEAAAAPSTPPPSSLGLPVTPPVASNSIHLSPGLNENGIDFEEPDTPGKPAVNASLSPGESAGHHVTHGGNADEREELEPVENVISKEEEEGEEGEEQASPRPISKDFDTVPTSSLAHQAGASPTPPPPSLPPKQQQRDVAPTSDSKNEGGPLHKSDSTYSEGGMLEDVSLVSREGSEAPTPAPEEDSAVPIDEGDVPTPPSHSPPPAGIVAPSIASATTTSTSTNGSSLPRSTSTPSITSKRTSISTSNPSSTSLASGILIISSLEQISQTKEAKKSKSLREACENALGLLRSTKEAGGAGGIDQLVVFEPLKLACETKSESVMIIALDCIGKLVSYDFFVEPEPTTPHPRPSSRHNHSASNGGENDGGGDDVPDEPVDPSLADLITTTVCNCFTLSNDPPPTSSSSSTATTPRDTLLLRLLSSLLSLILSNSLKVHQSSLLKSVRTVYTIYLSGSVGTVQVVAQATLGQIVGGVFGRVKIDEHIVPATPVVPAGVGLGVNGGTVREEDETAANELEDVEQTPRLGAKESLPEVNVTEDRSEAVISDDIEEPKTPTAFAGISVAPVPTPGASTENVTLETIENRRSFDGVPERGPIQFISQNDMYIKDAFLVFRALCKLSMKPLVAENESNLKSPSMRSKLLSLHLVLSILQTNLALFVSPSVVIHSSTSSDRTPFISAIKQYLCLALSRNAVSPVIQVFELSCEIFWRVLSGMRTRLKKEIEVLLNEIFLPILEMRNSTVKQKSILLAVFGRLAGDPQALVDIYLNYDCDRSSLDNIYERLVNIVSKLGTTHFPSTSEKPGTSTVSAAASSPFPNGLPTLTEDSKLLDPAFAGLSLESHLKRQSLECLVSVLKSLVNWASKGAATAGTAPATGSGTPQQEGAATLGRTSEEGRGGSEVDLNASVGSQIRGGSGAATPDVLPSDDPSRFENAKQRKTTLLEGIKKFNFKPKRGVAFLIDTGFIKSREPKDVARFLLHADGLDKAQIGEYLGEGEPENIAAMHAFVDLMDFSSSPFVDALRMFLQSFRLPGEAQKIDRYMLKFAERYTAGNPGVFANADTAYILAFSVILLNTDAHNPQVKKPMSKVEFIKNNRGIDDGKDLPEELLSGIYDEINANEIRMKDEVEAAGPQTSTTGLANAIATVGRDLQREAYVWQSEGMVNKTEALFRTLVRGQRRGAGRPAEQFFSASHFEHVRPMFEVAWMPILAGISGPLQTTDDLDLVTLSLEGFKQAIKIVCLFDLELERNAFVTTLAKFTFLNNLGEMKAKNVEAIKTLLDVAMVDGNYLKGSWREVLTCVSQLERFQLIAQGVDSHSVPELGRKPTKDRRSTVSAKNRNSRPTDEVALETRSQSITIIADMIFSSTPQLSGTAIVDFVQALSDVSWEEIQSSGLAEQPRVFCLQKLVEISYYNMSRIRLEWSAIWLILGEHFNQVTCHTNAKVSFLALDSLRQLAMRFLEKEELANFKFQKDFLKPFEYAMIHNNNPDARDMVLQCLHQMIQARVQNLRSGWRTMFGVFSAAAKVANERIAIQAFDIVQRVNKEHFSRIVAYGSFADLTVCITDFSKISKYQRASLQAIEMLKEVIPMMLNCPECPLSPRSTVMKTDANANDDPMLRFWFPVLFGFYDVIMNGEDLEVRKRALDYLFDTLKKHGQTFPPDFWDTVCKEVLFPIFAVLRSRSDVSRFSTHEDMSVWLSTTMIQALRNLVDLFTFYFDELGRMLDRLLDLLCECICQENDTLARIGTSCLQQLLENNVQKLSPARWERIVSTFVHLFKTTTAYQLFDENLIAQQSDESAQTPEATQSPNGFVAPTPLSPAPDDQQVAVEKKPILVADRRRIFRQIIVKCVLQLLLIETTHELLQNEGVYTTIPPSELLKLMSALDESYRFARKFNADKELRMALWKVGFMRDLPNLLRQESTSASTLVNVLLRMYNDTQADHVQKRSEVVGVFAPLGLDVLSNFVSLNPETQARNIAAWAPVCGEILQGFCSFEDEPFKEQLPLLYPLVTSCLTKETTFSLQPFFVRVGKTVLGL